MLFYFSNEYPDGFEAGPKSTHLDNNLQHHHNDPDCREWDCFHKQIAENGGRFVPQTFSLALSRLRAIFHLLK